MRAILWPVDGCFAGANSFQNDLSTELVTEPQNFIVAAHGPADPEVKVLRDDRNSLQDSRAHPDYLERNPCLTEGGKEL